MRKAGILAFVALGFTKVMNRAVFEQSAIMLEISPSVFDGA